MNMNTVVGLRMWMVLVVSVSMMACSGANRESEAAREVSLARDIEGDIDRLDGAIEAYKKIGATFGDVASGKHAGERASKLASIAGMIEGFKTAPEDSLPSVAGAILRKVPNYEPVLHRLGHHYANRSKLYTRAASKWRNPGMTGRLKRVWVFQDSLWSGYSFRPTHKDRTMRDALCVHGTNVARMFEGSKRYDEALEAIDRAISYGSGKDQLAEAKVFGAFYRFRTGDADGAVAYAKEALQNDDLEDSLRSRAYHVIGQVSVGRYQDHKSVVDLDEAIKSLNEAVGLDPGNGNARVLLKELRKARGALQAS
jgi:tetratricopeptide (TPR) repeat protein